MTSFSSSSARQPLHHLDLANRLDRDVLAVQPSPVDPAHTDPGALHIVEGASEFAITGSITLQDDGDGLTDQGGEHVGLMTKGAWAGLWSAESGHFEPPEER